MSRALLITGATGKQGGALIDALLAKKSPSADFLLLAATRNPSSPSAQRLQSKSPLIKLVEGDLNSVPSLFQSAKTAAGSVPLWGVFSVQLPVIGKDHIEVKQGEDLVDEARKAGVSQFVYSSVERGGDERSWENPTEIPHFAAKHEIEHHIRDSSAAAAGQEGGKDMKWTILRPVIFMDNLQPGLFASVFMTALRDTLKDKPMQWIACRDIGVAAAEAFVNPKEWENKAVGLASETRTFGELDALFREVTGKPVPTTFWPLGKLLKLGVKEVRTMLDWFYSEGYGSDVVKNRAFNPNPLTFEEYIKNSAFVKGASK